MFSIPEPTVSPARRQPWGTVEMITPAHGTAVTLELMVSDVPHKRFQAGSEKDPSNSTAFSWLQVWTHPGSSRQHWALTCQGWSAAPVLMGQETALAQHRHKATFCPSWGWLYRPLPVAHTQFHLHAACIFLSRVIITPSIAVTLHELCSGSHKLLCKSLPALA